MTMEMVGLTASTESETTPISHDPWAGVQQETTAADGWLLSYVDVLTLLLILMVVLLMLQHQGKPDEALELVAGQPAEVRPKPQSEPVGVEDGERLAERKPDKASDQGMKTENQSEVSDKPFMTGVELDLSAQEDAVALLVQSLSPPGAGSAQSDGISMHIKEKENGKGPESKPRPESGVESPSLDPRPFVEMLRWKGLGDGITLSTTETQLRLETRDNILFSDASAELTDGGAGLLQELAQVFVKQPGIISVEGHADSRPIVSGSYPSNWELSAARAAGVVRYLVEQGVAARRLRAIGYSDTRPRADNVSSEGRAANRRVSLVLELQPGGQSAPAPQRSLM